MIKQSEEKSGYEVGKKKTYQPELINDVLNIFVEEVKILNGEDD